MTEAECRAYLNGVRWMAGEAVALVREHMAQAGQELDRDNLIQAIKCAVADEQNRAPIEARELAQGSAE